MILSKAFHEPAGAVYHGGALVYVLSAYTLGWYGLFASHWLINLVAVLLLPQSCSPVSVGLYAAAANPAVYGQSAA